MRDKVVNTAYFCLTERTFEVSRVLEVTNESHTRTIGKVLMPVLIGGEFRELFKTHDDDAKQITLQILQPSTMHVSASRPT